MRSASAVQDKIARQESKTTEQNIGFEGTRQRKGKTKVQDSSARQQCKINE